MCMEARGSRQMGSERCTDGSVTDPGPSTKEERGASAFPAASADPSRLTAVLPSPQDSWLTQGAGHSAGATSGQDPGRSELPCLGARCLLCKETSVGGKHSSLQFCRP